MQNNCWSIRNLCPVDPEGKTIPPCPVNLRKGIRQAGGLTNGDPMGDPPVTGLC